MRKPCTICGCDKGPGIGRRVCDSCLVERHGCLRCGAPKPKGRGRRLCDACEPVQQPKGLCSPCRDCGGREGKLPGKQICEECRAIAEWRHKRRNHGRKVKVRKPCLICKRVKSPGKGRLYCDACLAERAKPGPCERCHEKPKRYRLAKLCEVCKHEAVSHHYEKRRGYYRERYAAGLVKPRRRRSTKQLREIKRMSNRLRAMQGGREILPVVESDPTHGTSLPGGPLAAVVYAAAERNSITHSRVGVLCERIGVFQRDVARWKTGESDATLRQVDLVLTRLGVMWWDVWTEETVRIPRIEARVYRWRMIRSKRRLYCVRKCRYGDAGPDRKQLARIAGVLDGEEALAA